MKKHIGVIVITKSGKTGITHGETQNGKIVVHITDDLYIKTGEKLFCGLSSLTIIGYVD